MNTKRTIAIFTGNRAEYGLLNPIIRAIADHPALEYRLLVSGAHLQQDFGRTLDEIERDGFSIAGEVAIEMDQDTLFATAQAIGTGILSLSRLLVTIKPDLFVVYADRYEAFSAAITGTQMNIPTAHIEGGDITEGGALDDSVRHAITKLAHLHFTTNRQAAERVLRLGEEPWRVFDVGLPVMDLIAEGEFATPEELSDRYGIDTAKPVVIFTQHSVTTEFELAAEQARPAFEAMKRLAADGCQIVVTYPNNDAGGKRIIAEIAAQGLADFEGVQVHKSLGRYNYHGFLNLCGRAGIGVCVGNSSSGIKETPVFGCPTVNIGSRQDGRLRSTNVIDTEYDATTIESACRKSLYDNEFRHVCATCENPYGRGNAGRMIAEALATIELSPRLLQKKMTY